MNPGLDSDDVDALCRPQETKIGNHTIKADAKPQTAPRLSLPTLHIQTSFEVEPPPLDFVWPGFVAGTVGCIAAAGSTGKSFFSLQAAMSVTSAAADEALLQLGCKEHGRAVILNAEDHETVVKQRLFSIASHLNTTAREEVAQRLTVMPLMGMGCDIMQPQWFDAVVEASLDARLIVLDTFSRWHRLSENDNGEMAQVVGQLERVAKETGASVLFLHHVSKGMAVNGRQDEQQATRGAAAIVDNARWQGFMQTMTKEEALRFGVSDAERTRFVSAGGNKENYGPSAGNRWFERCAGGVLLPVDLAAPAKAIKKVGFKDEA